MIEGVAALRGPSHLLCTYLQGTVQPPLVHTDLGGERNAREGRLGSRDLIPRKAAESRGGTPGPPGHMLGG